MTWTTKDYEDVTTLNNDGGDESHSSLSLWLSLLFSRLWLVL